MFHRNFDVELIPWDAQSDTHIERLRQQRVVCGWRAESVEEWKQQQLEQKKALHWITLKPRCAEYEAVLTEHLFRFPLEHQPLLDTAPMISPRPKINSFIPIGHISIDLEHYGNDKSQVDPSSGRYGVSAMYISPAARGHHFASEAIEALKFLAAGPPFYGRFLTMETISKESSQQHERYAAFGVPTPKFSLLDWYKSIGCKEFKENKTGWTETDPTGKVWTIGLVCLELDIRKYGESVEVMRL